MRIGHWKKASAREGQYPPQSKVGRGGPGRKMDLACSHAHPSPVRGARDGPPGNGQRLATLIPPGYRVSAAVMAASGFVRLVSISVGLAVLPVTVLAFRTALAYPRDVEADAIRFGPVLPSGGLGVSLVLAGRLVPALHRAADRTSPSGLRLFCAVSIGVVALTARPAGIPAPWVGLAAGLLAVLYVVPGLAFRGIGGRPRLGLRDLSVLAGESGRRLPRSRRHACAAILGLPLLGVVPLMLGLDTLPSAG